MRDSKYNTIGLCDGCLITTKIKECTPEFDEKVGKKLCAVCAMAGLGVDDKNFKLRHHVSMVGNLLLDHIQSLEKKIDQMMEKRKK